MPEEARSGGQVALASLARRESGRRFFLQGGLSRGIDSPLCVQNLALQVVSQTRAYF